MTNYQKLRQSSNCRQEMRRKKCKISLKTGNAYSVHAVLIHNAIFYIYLMIVNY